VLGPNDYDFFNNYFFYNINNIVGYDKIYIITDKDNFKMKLKNVENISKINIIDEGYFGFNKELLKKINSKRYGWYLQQLLKLYYHKICNQQYYLVIDADTLFLKQTTFFNGKIPLYNTGTEHHRPYFNHIQKFIPVIKRETNMSGICHHMMFNVEIVKEIFDYVEKKHNTPFYKAFMNCVDNKELNRSGASEYEIYFNYLLRYKKDKMIIRKLKWKNVSQFKTEYKNIYDYISIHYYLR